MGDVVELACGRLRAAGIRITQQRRQLLRVFAGMDRWCTPQELYQAAEAAGQHPGLATVYRLVETLCSLGLCKSFPQSDRTVRYVFCPPFHHHHLICLDCGRVRNITDCHVEQPASDFTVREHSVDFFGQCPRCAEHLRGAPSPPS